jgi:hypothetical protein
MLADPLELADFVADLALVHAFEDRTVAAENEVTCVGSERDVV